MSLLKYQEWNVLNEANLFDEIKNWLSRSFGGSIDKLDSLLNQYKKSELRFVDEWEEIRVKIDELELERSQVKNDPAELKKIDRMIDRNQAIVPTSAKAHEKKTDDLFDKAKGLIKDNKKLQAYWETNKVKVDSEVAEEMYTRAKKLADDSITSDLYTKFKKAVLNAKEKDSAFRKKYGNLLGDKPERSSKKGESVGKEYSDSNFELLSKLSITEFAEAVKDFPKEEAKQLASYLLKERNDLYVAMDMERDNLNTEISKMPKDHKTKEYAAQKVKDIREEYMGKIRELRSKITVARKHA